MASITDDNGAIQTGLRADVMRKSMENKNLLSSKGSIYVGTGDTNDVVVSGSTVSIPKTAALTVGNQNEVLSVGTNNTLQYSKIRPNMMQSSAFTYDIICARALFAEHAASATTATKSVYAIYSGNSDNTGADESETIYTKFKNCGNSLRDINAEIEQIETVMNQGDHSISSSAYIDFFIISHYRSVKIATLYLSNDSIRYYNSCSLKGTLRTLGIDEGSSTFDSDYDAFYNFYSSGGIATGILHGINNLPANFLPQEDVEFSITPGNYVNYDIKTSKHITAGKVNRTTCTVKTFPSYILKITTDGSFTLKTIPPLASKDDSSSEEGMELDSWELRKHSNAVESKDYEIKIGYFPQINE